MTDKVVVGILVILASNITTYICATQIAKYDVMATIPKLANEHGRMLGRIVDAKMYEGSEWERAIVVAVGWRGAMCVRPMRDIGAHGRWIRKDLVPHRVREVANETE